MYNGIVIGLGIIVILINYLYWHKKNKDFFGSIDGEKDFETAKKEAELQIEAEFAKKISSRIKKEQEARKEATKKIEEIEKKTEQYNEELRLATEKRDARLAAIEEEYESAIKQKSLEEATALNSVTEYYHQKKAEEDEAFEEYKMNIEARKTVLNRELEKARARQQEIIEEYKRAEQIKQNKDFYRIKLSDTELSDVKKLRKIAEELHDPSVIYKLIYKTYYERPFNEMVGRVVTGRGAVGIYKITNLENGRVYIGQTRQTFKERWRTHVKRGVKAEPGTQNKLYAAMWEEGVENFSFEVLAECKADELNEKEKEYITMFHGDSWGYNSNGGIG